MRRLRLALVVALAVSFMLPSAALADDIIHTVQPGENLFRIGLKYGVRWQDIAAANGLPGIYIYVGQQLRIPVGGSTAPAQEAAPAAAPAELPAPATAEGGTYTVARGDTLGSIAQRFGTTASALAAANNIPNPNRIFYGQTLTIPGGGQVAAAPASAPAAAPVAPTAYKEIHVDISEQRMRVYENGGLLWEWVISTGEPGRDTAPGNYSVLNKIPNAYASTWNLWMPNWLGIYWVGYLQNGIHALPILSNGTKLWAGWLGTPVSYGCVILDDSTSATLYNWAEIGTAVIIRW